MKRDTFSEHHDSSQELPLEYLKKRVSAVEKAVDTLHIDGLLVSAPTQKGYLSGLTNSLNIAPAGMILITGSGGVNHYLTSGTDQELCRKGAEPVGFRVSAYSNSKGQTITGEMARLVAELGLKSVGVEGAYISVQEFDNLKSSFSEAGTSLVAVGPVVDPLREIKDSWEIDQIKKANEVCRKAFEHVMGVIHPGMTEWHLAAELENQLRVHGHGSSRLAFTSVVVSGPRTSLPHGHPTRRTIQEGELVTMDFGATWNGYCADVTRTFVMGKASDRQREVYHAVLEAQVAAIDLMRLGRQRDEAGKTAMKMLTDNGLGEYMAHGVGGHGIGLEVHEGPRARQGGPWQAGNVMTMEPGVYIPDWGGVRIEDDVVIRSEGPEIITPIPKDFLEIIQ